MKAGLMHVTMYNVNLSVT